MYNSDNVLFLVCLSTRFVTSIQDIKRAVVSDLYEHLVYRAQYDYLLFVQFY